MPSLRSLPDDLRLFAKYHLRRRVYDYPAPENELGVVDLGFDIDAFLERLWAAGTPHAVEIVERVGYRGRDYPILCVSTRPQGTRHTLAVLAGIHGNEPAGMLAVPEIVERFAPLR